MLRTLANVVSSGRSSERAGSGKASRALAHESCQIEIIFGMIVGRAMVNVDLKKTNVMISDYYFLNIFFIIFDL